MKPISLQVPPRAAKYLVPAAAVVAVAFWSLKPVLVTLVGDRVGFTELYAVSALAGVLASYVIAQGRRREMAALMRGGRKARDGALWAAASGVALALWYYGFYRALFTAAKADATVIAFLWPLIAAVAVPLLSKTKVRRLTGLEWTLVLIAFGGAVAVAGPGSVDGAWSSGIAWAFAAAFGSGIYLPFALNATAAFDEILGSKLTATFFAVALANMVALLTVCVALGASGYPLDLSGFDAEVVGICLLIGVGTYVLAELAWTWAFRETKSLTLTSLPYLSPAVSVLLLFALFGEPVRPATMAGLVAIVSASLAMHVIGRTVDGAAEPAAVTSRPAADPRS